MSGRVNRYAVLNAKLRTRLGRMLPEALLSSIRRAATLEEAVLQLAGTSYDNLSGTIEDIEAALLAMEIKDLLKVLPVLEGSVLGVGEAYLIRYETELLKRALRAVFSRQVLDTQPPDTRMESCLPLFPRLPLGALLESPDLDDAEERLKGTGYAGILSERKGDVLRYGSLFPLESGLDRFFFRRLLEAIDELPQQDREIARRMTGVEIDMLNLSSICRLTGFSGTGTENMESHLVPGGLKTEPRGLARTAGSGRNLDSIEGYITDLYPGFKVMVTGTGSDTAGRLAIFEAAVEAVLDREIRRILLGNPFTIGILPAYFILKRKEVQSLISALNSAAYGKKPENGTVPA